MDRIVWTHLHTAFILVVLIAMLGMTLTTATASAKRGPEIASSQSSDWKCHPIHPGQSACFNMIDGNHMIVATSLK
jgi:hypothetical protein